MLTNSSKRTNIESLWAYSQSVEPRNKLSTDIREYRVFFGDTSINEQ